MYLCLMICNTKSKSEDGTQEWKYKKAFKTLDEAIIAAKKQNAKETTIEKLVAYKCTYCYEYHIGRNGKRLTDKEKDKYRKDLGIGIKVLGKINLDLLQPKSPVKVVGWIDLNKIRY